MDAKVDGISSALNMEAALSDADIMVDNPSEWLVLPVSGNKGYAFLLVTA